MFNFLNQDLQELELIPCTFCNIFYLDSNITYIETDLPQNIIR